MKPNIEPDKKYLVQERSLRSMPVVDMAFETEDYCRRSMRSYAPQRMTRGSGSGSRRAQGRQYRARYCTDSTYGLARNAWLRGRPSMSIPKARRS